MLGKTNITTLKEGAIVTEIEDYRWIQMASGIYGNFVKAVYKNDYLAAITADGIIVYTMDGETWQTSKLEYSDCRLNDIEWDGSKFVIVGRFTDTDGTSTKGLIVTSGDLTTFSVIEGLYECKEVFGAFYENGRFIFICCSDNDGMDVIYTDLTKSGTIVKNLNRTKADTMSIGKNANGILVFANRKYIRGSSGDYSELLFITSNHTVTLKEYTVLDFVFKTAAVFECKNILYAMGLHETTGYELDKVTDSAEIMAMCTGQNFMFVDGVYFNECQLFINSHEMLIVKKGESIADKTIDDLVEIAPEITMNCIVRAFGQLYIFGNQGVILKSSVETNNENSIMVQTLSAKKALEDAKAYTDMKINELKELLNYQP